MNRIDGLDKGDCPCGRKDVYVSEGMCSYCYDKPGNHVQGEPSQEDRTLDIYHTHCHDCGQFLKKGLRVRKDDLHKAHGLCRSCLSNYDDT